MARKTLKFTPDYNFELLALVSSSNIYQLAFTIAQATGLNFEVDESLSICHPKLTTPQEFAVFICEEEENLLTLRLIANKCNNGILLEELKNIDYFIHISGDDNQEYAVNFIETLKQSSETQGVYSIDPNKLVSKQKLVF